MELSKIGSLIFYLVLFSLSAFLLYLGNKKNSKILKFFSVIIPVLIGGLRYFVGTDYTNYIDYYIIYGPMPLSEYLSINGIFEILFYFIARISYLCTNQYYLLFFISNAIIVIFAYLTVQKSKINNKHMMWLLFLFLYFPMFFNAVRQGISIALTYYMIVLLLNNERKKSLFISLLSPLFHASGIITILMYFILLFIKNRVKKNIRNIIIFSFLVLIFIPLAFNLLSFTPYLNRYLSYETMNIDSNNYIFFLKFVILLILLLFYKGMQKVDTNSFFYYLLFSGEVVLTLLGFISPFIKRVTLYFSLGQILILPNLVDMGVNKFSNNSLKILIILYAIIYFVLAYYILGQSDIFPFEFISF